MSFRLTGEKRKPEFQGKLQKQKDSFETPRNMYSNSESQTDIKNNQYRAQSHKKNLQSGLGRKRLIASSKKLNGNLENSKSLNPIRYQNQKESLLTGKYNNYFKLNNW